MGMTPDRREVAIEADGLKLEGALHLPDGATKGTPSPGVVVAHPHPQYGGDMDNPVVQALCEAALEAGAAVLRFNFRGVGFSEGKYDEGVGEQRDLAAAVDYLRNVPEVDSGRVAVAGYSFGSVVALRLADGREDLAAVVAVSNPTIRGPKLELHLPVPALFVTAAAR